MFQILKDFVNILPTFLIKFLHKLFCWYHSYICRLKDSQTPYTPPTWEKGGKIRIAFYHISGLHFGGTEKFLQIIAKHLDPNKFEVFFIYSSKSRTKDNLPSDTRKEYLLNSHVKLIEFEYESIDTTYPFYVKGTKPRLNQLLNQLRPHVVMSAGTGYPEYPLNIETKVPIIYTNNFGAGNTQKNFFSHICVSNTVANMTKRVTSSEKVITMYVQSEKPIFDTEDGKLLRARFNIPTTDTVFGRIGRASDDIFDPIGIKAFEKVVATRSDVHYLIMAAPPLFKTYVDEHKVKNVYFLPASGKESDVWAFHNAIDVLAHFRFDGESFGLNIAESMIVGNPIITHKSHIWNAHLEYLDNNFSRVANKDDFEQYARFMVEFADLHKNGGLLHLRKAAAKKASDIFIIDNNIVKIENLIIDHLSTP